MHYEALSTEYYEIVFILALVIRHADYYIVTRGLSGCTVFFHIIT
jgi:hypothetical protein